GLRTGGLGIWCVLRRFKCARVAGLERRLVGEVRAAAGRRGRGPRVVRRRRGRGRAAVAVAVSAAATTTPTAATTAAAGGPGDLGGGVPQRRADLVDLHLAHRALLALTGFERPLYQPALHDDPEAALQRLGGVLAQLPPRRAAQEQRLAVLPLPGLPVERAGRG